MLLGNIMKYYNDQIPDVLEKIICKDIIAMWIHEHPSIKRITPDDI